MKAEVYTRLAKRNTPGAEMRSVYLQPLNGVVGQPKEINQKNKFKKQYLNTNLALQAPITSKGVYYFNNNILNRVILY